ncbi:efflux transporter periplasmic adaptor subunit [Nostoc sp. 'Peltigera membranacea cyanobiont' 210A]|uniref:efflux RND transporter periplasmic adaptor subunit n=1 Tax=Nostoc sp. 'Peltigera membranacea cyanobiont' 210A TaxID=2014529 RepID=UPI000B957443|nr:efflux RND transporter periplasmic adaptor subunit [Nostoc sp. 'Peltigera membranacea cyanobiont' 210A]OYD90806.1 efflux transporter periplasmic adaptor subunit [Nostoc sp. 'Peltigera membranacea cyanobiont' 210A]
MTSPEPQTDFGEKAPQTSFEPPSGKRRWLWLSLAALLLLGGGATLVWRLLTPQNSAPSNTNAQPQGVRVKISTVQSGIIEESSDFIASLKSLRSVTLQPRIQGQVTQILVKSGDPVVEGAAILQVDPTRPAGISGSNTVPQAFLVQLANARATLKSLEAERPSYVANLQLYQQNYEKFVSLAEQGAVSRQTSNQFANRLANAKTSLDAIDSRIQAQRATILQAEKSLQQSNVNTQTQQPQSDKITAPFSGTVGNIPVKVGDLVNTSTPLVNITQNRPLEVNISVPLQQGPQLRKGMPVEVMNTQGQKLGRSRIFFIAPNASNETQTILIKALFDNTNGQLRADQLVRARVFWNQRPGVLIPTTAMTRVGGDTFVYVVETEISPQGVSQQVARQRRVKLGEIKGNNYQVIEGLQPEDKVIISGLLNLRDGVAIVPEF